MANMFDNLGGWGSQMTGFLDKIFTFDIGSFNIAGVGPNTAMIANLVIYLAVFLFGGIIVYKLFFEYGKIRVSLRFITRGGSIIDIKEDSAKEVIDRQGKRKLEFLWLRKINFPPVPNLKYRYKKGKKDYYEFVVDDNNDLHPCEIASEKSMYDDEGNINDILKSKIVPQERTAWTILEKKQVEEKIRRKGWMDKYGHIVVPTMAMVTAILIVYFTVQQVGSGMSSLAGQFGQVAANCLRGG